MLLSACDGGDWSTAVPDWIEERIDGAVEVIARRSDGTILAIEHTLVQPFVNEKLDSTAFMEAFARIDRNPALVLPERHLEALLPVHSIPNGYRWEDVGADLLAWLTANHTAAPTEGASNHRVSVCCGLKRDRWRIISPSRPCTSLATQAVALSLARICLKNSAPWSKRLCGRRLQN